MSVMTLSLLHHPHNTDNPSETHSITASRTHSSVNRQLSIICANRIFPEEMACWCTWKAIFFVWHTGQNPLHFLHCICVSNQGHSVIFIGEIGFILLSGAWQSQSDLFGDNTIWVFCQKMMRRGESAHITSGIMARQGKVHSYYTFSKLQKNECQQTKVWNVKWKLQILTI